MDLYESLCDRVDLDKDVLVLSNQICKETDIPLSHSVKLGSRLLSFSRALNRAVQVMDRQSERRQRDISELEAAAGHQSESGLFVFKSQRSWALIVSQNFFCLFLAAVFGLKNCLK